MAIPLDVDPGDLYAASRLIGNELAPELNTAFVQLGSDINGTANMAGEDLNGQNWGASYDKAAQHLSVLVTRLVEGAYKLAVMLERTGFNHGLADSFSDPAHTSTVVDHSDYGAQMSTLQCVNVPTAAGGTASYPTGWAIVRGAIGIEWPDGDPGLIGRAGAGWEALGLAIRDREQIVDLASASVLGVVSPESADAALTCTDFKNSMAHAASLCLSLARCCRDFSSALSTAQVQSAAMLEGLAAHSAVVQVATLIFAAETEGTSVAVGETLESAEIAAVRNTVHGNLVTFGTAADKILVYTSSIDGEVLAITDQLDPLMTAPVVGADTEVVANLPNLAYTTEAAQAEQRLAAAASSPLAPVDQIGWRSQVKLTDHFNRHGNDFGATSAAQYADLSTDFLERARTGQYQVKVGPDGTVRVYDPATNTFASCAPDGTIRTFFKPTPRGYWARQPGVLQ